MGWVVRRGGEGSGDLVIFCDNCWQYCRWLSLYIYSHQENVSLETARICVESTIRSSSGTSWVTAGATQVFYSVVLCYKKAGFLFPSISLCHEEEEVEEEDWFAENILPMSQSEPWFRSCTSSSSLSLYLTSPWGCMSLCHNQHAVVISLLITTSHHRHTKSSINSIGIWAEYYNHWLLRS